MTAPYTPATLAQRWACSDETIRQMIARGELRAFRVGKMWRIPAKIVEDMECQNIESEGSTGGSSSHGMGQMGDGGATALSPLQRGKLRQRLAR